jgi:hypothetical protein
MVFKVMDHLWSIRIAIINSPTWGIKNCRAFQYLRICNSVKGTFVCCINTPTLPLISFLLASIRSKLPDAYNEQFSKRVERWLTEAKNPRKKKNKVVKDDIEL